MSNSHTPKAAPVAPYTHPDRVFAGTADEYAKYRPSHPQHLVRFLAEQLSALTALHTGAQVLDLGSGPGTLALDLARYGVPVVAVDASAEMLAAGRRSAAERGVTTIAWVRADAHDGEALAALGPICAVTVGDAFHWMNRQHVVDLLDGLVLPGGLVALLGSHAPGTPRAWWEPLLAALRQRYLGDSRLAGVDTVYVEPVGGHEEILRRSRFSRITAVRSDYRRRFTLQELIGLQLTYAYSSPVVLGDRRADFERDIRTALRAVQPDGPYEADLQAALLIARRPTAL